jgi:two-component system, OmpR family, phosphate regulon sensor histidine kinase PhoR
MRKQKKLLWKLFQSHIIITLISLVTVGLFASQSLRYLYLGQIRDDLKIRAELFSRMIPEERSDTHDAQINKLCRVTGPDIGTRITVVMSGGVVIGDSDEDIGLMDNHGDRPEIQTALSGDVGMSTRYSYTLEKDLIYVAVPLVRNGSIIGVVRTSKPVATVVSSLRGSYSVIAFIVTVISLIAVLASFLLSRKINAPISEMIRGASHFADGDLDYRISVEGIAELETLANGMNSMAAQLSNRISTISEQRNEIEAILTGMVEAVIAIDSDGLIIECNRAAEKLFGLFPGKGNNKNIQEAIRNTFIQDIVDKVLSGQKLLEEEIVYHGSEDAILHVHGSPLSDPFRDRRGAVLVFNNITRMKKLENVRRDFVANVSHELKTPIASIIGFIETLNDGAIDDMENRQRFLDIVLKHSKRLNSIVEDLLSLSRLEQNTEKDALEIEKFDICAIVSSAISLYEKPALIKGISITQSCESAQLNCNSSLLIQAVGNLIDNAIKYSPENSSVSISSSQNDTTFRIEVQDSGPGIPSEQTERIFERFYRIDKGRSRDLGGTGLGLSIVKHIVIAHGGNISVDSSSGSGSTFIITLPLT